MVQQGHCKTTMDPVWSRRIGPSGSVTSGIHVTPSTVGQIIPDNNTGRWTDVDLMLGQRCRRSTNSKLTLLSSLLLICRLKNDDVLKNEDVISENKLLSSDAITLKHIPAYVVPTTDNWLWAHMQAYGEPLLWVSIICVHISQYQSSWTTLDHMTQKWTIRLTSKMTEQDLNHFMNCVWYRMKIFNK